MFLVGWMLTAAAELYELQVLHRRRETLIRVATVLAAGGSPLEAAELANHAAAIEVGKTGVATVTPTEILDHIEAHLLT